MEEALWGIRVLAKIAQQYEQQGYQHSDTPLCFNALAGQAKNTPECFSQTFEVSQIDWQDPHNIVITAPEPINVRKIKPK